MTSTQERMERSEELITLERMHAVQSDGTIVGGAAAFGFNVTVLTRGDALFRWDRHPWCPEIC